MASGVMHTKATLILAGAIIPYYGADYPEKAISALLAGLWAVLASPDLDQLDDGSKGYYGLYVLDRTAPVSSRLWRLYWQPYARLFAHRSFWTHFPIVGTTGRLIYGGWWFVPILVRHIDIFTVFLVAVMSADFLHWVMDWRIWRRIGLFEQ